MLTNPCTTPNAQMTTRPLSTKTKGNTKKKKGLVMSSSLVNEKDEPI